MKHYFFTLFTRIAYNCLVHVASATCKKFKMKVCLLIHSDLEFN